VAKSGADSHHGPMTPTDDTATKPARILVVDDHAIVRHGLALLLSKHPDLGVAGEAGSYDEALAELDRKPYDVALVDITLKERSGLDLIREIRQRHPALLCLVLSMHDENEYAERALRAGARGYVMKEDADEVIVEAIRTVRRGEVYASPEVSARMLRQIVDGEGPPAEEGGVGSLTDREREIFRCLGEGLTTRKIAEKFTLSARTVEVHRANIKRKLGCEDTAQLLREAVKWVERGGA
jgi:DNA-binding NarL/FixJ family response regulator